MSGFGDRVVAAFDVAVVGREIERRPAALVREIDVAPCSSSMRPACSAGCSSRQQRRPAVFRRLVDVRAGSNQHLRRFEVAFARRKDQRRQAAAAAADQTGDDDVGIVGFRELSRTSLFSFREFSASGGFLGTDELENRIDVARAVAWTTNLAIVGSRLSKSRAAGAGRASRWLLRSQLLLVRAVVLDGLGPTFHSRFDIRGIHLLRHVISRQAGGTRFCGVVSAAIEQRFHRSRMFLFDCPHQRRGAADGFLRVDIRSASSSNSMLQDSVAGCEHHHRFALRSLLLCVGAGVQQNSDQIRVAISRSHIERSDVFTSLRLHSGSRFDQKQCRLQVIAIYRPVKGCRTVNLGLIDIRFLLDKLSQERLIAFHRGVRHFRPFHREERYRSETNHDRNGYWIYALIHAGDCHSR